jgi:hypothetical protein
MGTNVHDPTTAMIHPSTILKQRHSLLMIEIIVVTKVVIRMVQIYGENFSKC